MNNENKPISNREDYLKQKFSFGLIFRLTHSEMVALIKLIETNGYSHVYDMMSLKKLRIVEEEFTKKE